MAKRVRLEIPRSAVKQVLSMPAVRVELVKRAESIATASGGKRIGYDVQSSQGKNRARAAVIAGPPRAGADNRKYNTILKNVYAGKR